MLFKAFYDIIGKLLLQHGFLFLEASEGEINFDS